MIAKKLFQKRDLDDFIYGIMQLGVAFKQLKKNLKDCKIRKEFGVTDQDLVELGEMAAIFKNPSSVAYHLGR